MASFGEGIPLSDLYQLLTSIRSKLSLQLDTKILNGPWEPISPLAIKNMILAINTGKIQDGQEIQLRLRSNSKTV
jgi:hypothetical protein